jgi:hypothetical protein
MSAYVGKPGEKVVQLSKCDGSPSNVAILVEGPRRGATIHRQDGQPPNACPSLRRFIEHGIGVNPRFPHSPCSTLGERPEQAHAQKSAEVAKP